MWNGIPVGNPRSLQKAFKSTLEWFKCHIPTELFHQPLYEHHNTGHLFLLLRYKQPIKVTQRKYIVFYHSCLKTIQQFFAKREKDSCHTALQFPCSFQDNHNGNVMQTSRKSGEKNYITCKNIKTVRIGRKKTLPSLNDQSKTRWTRPSICKSIVEHDMSLTTDLSINIQKHNCLTTSPALPHMLGL